MSKLTLTLVVTSETSSSTSSPMLKVARQNRANERMMYSFMVEMVTRQSVNLRIEAYKSLAEK